MNIFLIFRLIAFCLIATLFILPTYQNILASQIQPSKQSSKSHPLISIITKVNNQIITNIDLMDRYNLVLTISKIKAETPQEKQALLNQILQRMIDEELQIQKASDLKITLDQEKLNQSLEEISHILHQKPTQIKNFLSQKNLSYNSLLRQLKAQILWPDTIKATLVSKIKVSQSEIDELLELRKINPNVNKFFLFEIFIPFDYKNQNDILDSKNLAYKIFDEIQRGGKFNNFVKQFSKSPTAEFNGEIGWVATGDIDDKIYQEISKINIGDTTRPILMKEGYYLFKMTNKMVFSTLTEQDLQQVKNIIFNKKLQLITKGYLMDLYKDAYIVHTELPKSYL